MTPFSMNRLYREYHEWKSVFWRCAALNLLAYLGYIVHVTYAVDDYGAIFSNSGTIVSGRWVIDIIHNFVCRQSLMPAILPVACITLYVLTGILLCKLWQIEKRHCALVVSLWSIHPYLLDVYNVRFAALSLALGYLMTIGAILLCTRGKRGLALSILLLYCSLSTYQPVLGFAIAAIMVQVLLISYRDSFTRESIRPCIKLFLRYAIMFFLSIVIYMGFTKLLFSVFNVDANSRFQSGFITEAVQLKAKLCVVATILFTRLIPMKELVLPLTGKLIIFVIYLGAATAIAIRGKSVSRILTALLWTSLIPVGAISFLLPLVALGMPWRVCLGLVVFAVGMFALTQESESLVVRRTCLGLGVFLIAYFILNNNAILYKQYLTNQKDLIMGNRIIAKMQSLEGYQPGMELAIIGETERETFSKAGKTNLEIIRSYIQYTSIRRYSLAKSAFETNWSKYSFLLNYMDLELKRCHSDTLKKAYFFSQDKKPWPDPSSVFIRDGIVILVLSHADGLSDSGHHVND